MTRTQYHDFITRTADDLLRILSGFALRPATGCGDLFSSYLPRLEVATIGTGAAWSGEGAFVVGVHPQELPTYILALRGLDQLWEVPDRRPGTSAALTGLLLSCLNFHYPIGNNIASTSSFSLFLFMIYASDFSFFVVCSQQTFDSQSKIFHYDYQFLAFSPISRPYPSHTCIALHILGAHPPNATSYAKAPPPPRHHIFFTRAP